MKILLDKKQARDQASAQSSASSTNPQDDIIDAEFAEKKN